MSKESEDVEDDPEQEYWVSSSSEDRPRQMRATPEGNTIWKYTFEIVDDFELELPKGARVLSVQTQHSVPCLWALVDSKAALEKRRFSIFGTGNPVPDSFLAVIGPMYIGTFQTDNGNGVWHLFEMTSTSSENDSR